MHKAKLVFAAALAAFALFISPLEILFWNRLDSGRRSRASGTSRSNYWSLMLSRKANPRLIRPWLTEKISRPLSRCRPGCGRPCRERSVADRQYRSCG
jgi:hypothetical protein